MGMVSCAAFFVLLGGVEVDLHRHANEIVTALQVSSLRKIMVAPVEGPSKTDAQRLGDALTQSMVESGVDVVFQPSLEGILSDEQLRAGLSDREWVEIAGGFGARWVLATQMKVIATGYLLSSRLISAKSGEVQKNAQSNITLVDEKDLAAQAESNRPITPIQIQLRRLADTLAQGLDELPGRARYQRLAVLEFDELGELSSDKKLGTLVAAELQTLFKRDHKKMVVERGQIAKIIDELALQQSGLFNEARTLEVGKMLGAQALILGTVSDAGADFWVNAKVVSVQSGDVALAEKVAFPSASMIALSKDAVELRSKAGAFYRSLILPGWGQVYNRQPVKAGIFAGAEILAVGAAVSFHVLGAQDERRYRNSQQQDFDSLVASAEQNYLLRNIFIGVIGAIHVANVLDAVISGYSPPK